MDKSLRIRTVLAITDVLQAEGWQVIDLTLSEFGFPTVDQWEGSHRSYLIEMLWQGDGELEALAVHLGVWAGGEGVGTPLPKSDAWKEGYFRLFLSHISTHKAFAHDLSKNLYGFAISGFVAHDDITPTADWIQEIEKALFSADALVALLHPGFQDSNWTDQEVGVMIGRHLPIMSVKFKTDPHGFLGRFQAMKGDDDPAIVANRIFDAVVSREDTKVQMSNAVVDRTENATGHIENQANFQLLKRITFLDMELAERLRRAMDDSYYVSKGYNKVATMRALFERFDIKLDLPESDINAVTSPPDGPPF